MDRPTYERASALFLQALELSPRGRAELLARECGGDPRLLAEVARMLAGDERASVLDRPAIAALFGADAREGLLALPATIGSYRILSRIGAGGMGVVFEAEQDHPKRRVALKVLASPFATERLRRRFELEASLLGRLGHPGIAHVYEAAIAETPQGPQPYFAMELVRGEPLTSFAEHNHLATAARLELLAKVCDAVEHAHQRGVIHRDLKPGNILVEANGQPKVLDFGVARATDRELQPSSLLTYAGELVGTLAYMSPEQLSGRPDAVDTRSDVYALGVIAFELVAGRLPYELDGLGLPEATRVVLEGPPARLSSLRRELRGDVSTIVAKALEKDKERRYGSARELATDLRRFLAREPILAKPASGIRLLALFARRHRGLSAGLGVAAATLVAGAWVSTGQAFDARRARDEARAQQGLAELRGAQALRHATRATIAAATVAAELDDVATSRRLLDSVEARERGFEWRRLAALGEEAIARIDSPRPICAAGFTKDGSAIVFVTDSGEFEHWSSDGAEHRSSGRLEDELTGPSALAQDGTRIAGVFGADGSQVGVWELATGRRLASAGAGGRPTAIALSPGGERVTFSSGRGFLWEPASGEAPQPFSSWQAAALALSGDGSRLATARVVRGGTYLIGHEAASGRAIGNRLVPGVDVQDLASDAAGAHFAAGCSDKRVLLVVTAGFGAPIELRGHRAAVRAVGFDDRTQRLASASDDGTIRVWDVARSALAVVLSGFEGTPRELAFRPDGGVLIARTERGLFVWDVSAGAELRPLDRLSSFGYGVAFGGNGARILSCSLDGSLRVVDSASGDLLWQRSPTSSGKFDGWALAAAPDAPWFASSHAGIVRAWDADAGVLLLELAAAPPEQNVIALAASADGSRLACRDESGVSLWDPRSGTELERWAAPNDTRFGDVAVSSDGTRVAANGKKGSVHLWSVGAPERARVLAGHTGSVEALAFSPDGRSLATGATDRSVRLSDVASGDVLWSSTGHSDRVYSLAFSPDGARLASGSNDTTIRLWDVATGEDVAVLAGHEDYVFGLAFSPDGRSLASVSGDATVRTWETRTKRERQAEGVRRKRSRDEARAQVGALMVELGEPRAVADRLRGDPGLNGEAREAWLQALLSTPAGGAK